MLETTNNILTFLILSQDFYVATWVDGAEDLSLLLRKILFSSHCFSSVYM